MSDTKKSKTEYVGKKDVVDAVSSKTGLTKDMAAKAIDATLETIAEKIANDEAVRFIGFGNFTRVSSPERAGRNPQTGEPLVIAASNRVKFTSSKTLKDRIN